MQADTARSVPTKSKTGTTAKTETRTDKASTRKPPAKRTSTAKTTTKSTPAQAAPLRARSSKAASAKTKTTTTAAGTTAKKASGKTAAKQPAKTKATATKVTTAKTTKTKRPARKAAKKPAKQPAKEPIGKPAEGGEDGQSFRFFDNREKYLLFVTTCGEKAVVAKRIGVELRRVQPVRPALRIFDAGMGDGTVLNDVMRNLHRRFRHVPWLVVAKEISVEDVRLSLEKLADRFYEHPQLVMVITNMNYREAPYLTARPSVADKLRWYDVPLEGNTSHEFCRQLRGLHPLIAEGWKVKVSEKTGNPLYETPSALVLYRSDQDFVLDPIRPKGGNLSNRYDLVMASQPYRLRISAEKKVKNVIAPLARALAPGGRMVCIQSMGDDPGMEVVNKLWPNDRPFHTNRHQLLAEAKRFLNEPEDQDLVFTAYSDRQSVFKYQMHTLPTDLHRSIGLSTVMSSWNAAIYVAQVEDERLSEVYSDGSYIDATQAVLRKHGRLWFKDETFVISRKRV